MTEENTPQVDNPESTEEVQEPTQFNSIEDAFQAARQTRAPKVEETEPEAEEEQKPEESEETEEAESTEEKVENKSEESEETESEEESEESDVLSQLEEIDWDSLPQETQDAIAEKLEVRSHVAFADLRTKLKDAEKELTELRESKANEVVESATGPNAFSKVTDVAELEKHVQQAEVNVDYFTDALLKKQITQYDEEKGDDIPGIEHDGKFYDKDFILNYIESQKAAIKDGRVREKQLKVYDEVTKGQKELVAKTKTKLGIPADSEASKQYDELIESSKFKTLSRAMPDYAKELIEVFGQSAIAQTESKGGKILLPRKGPKGKTKTVNPPGDSNADAGNSTSSRLAALTKKLRSGVASKEEALKIAREQRQLLRKK